MGDDIFKKMTGKPFDEAFGLPEPEESIKRIWRRSEYPARRIGQHGGNFFDLTEEERTHTHIIGTTQVGKSKFLELLVRQDIDRGNGLCFIDSSDGGKTAYNVLAYCLKNKIEKVILIDPLHHYYYGKFVPINPFGEYPESSAEAILENVLIQFDQKDAFQTPVIKKYLPAIIRLLHKAGATLPNVRWFDDPVFVDQRDMLFDKVSPFDPDRMMLESVFNPKHWDIYREFRPTPRRLTDLLHPIFQIMFNVKDGLDFRKLITEKWIVLVNLYAKGSFGPSHAKYLGTTIINKYVDAIDEIAPGSGRDGWKGRFYLYIDEAARYAGSNIAELLNYKAKQGLILTVAHQSQIQFKTDVWHDILALANIKVVFRLPNPSDQLMLAKTVYGGEVQDRDAAYYFGQLKKKECVIKLPGQKPVKITVDNVEDVDWKRSQLDELYKNPIYLNSKDYERSEGKDIVRPVGRTKSDRRATGKTHGRKTKHHSESIEAPPRPEIGSPETDTDRLWDSVFLETPGGQTEGGK